MSGIIIFHHFGTRTLNHFVKLTNGFTEKSYFYDFINNLKGECVKALWSWISVMDILEMEAISFSC